MTAKVAKQSNDDEQTDQLQQQVADLTEALQRERADATNIRRRHEEQIAGLKDMIKANVVRDLLPVIDNFERALKHVPEQSHKSRVTNHEELQKFFEWVEGVKKILTQFEKTLGDLGVEKIKTTGEPFDPKFHEAVSMDEDSEGETETVSEELQSGYKIVNERGDEVIRHAMVRVKMA